MSTSARITLFLVVAVSSVFAQNPTGTPSRAVTGTSSPTIVVPPPVVYVVPGGYYGGYYTGYYGYGAGAYMTPPSTLPAQSAGISLSNTAGISFNAPLQTGVTTAVPATSAGVYAAPGYGVQGNTLPGNSVIGYPGSEATISTTAGLVETGYSEGGRVISDLGPSYYLGAEPAQGSTNVPSLGEVAAKYKARPKNVRTYTNEDAERMVRTVKIGNSGARQSPQQNVPR